MNLAGYKFWKYTLFALGFLIFGFIGAGLTFALIPVDWTDSQVYLAMAGGFVSAGIAGGFCFICVYICVVFLMVRSCPG
jgi:hypothetical protein